MPGFCNAFAAMRLSASLALSCSYSVVVPHFEVFIRFKSQDSDFGMLVATVLLDDNDCPAPS
jgi:hypothetical protein